MDTVGGLFSTCSNTTQVSISNATTGWAIGWASQWVYTICPYYTTYARGHLYWSSYYTSCSTNCTFYIGGIHHHIFHRVSCHGTFVSNTDHYAQCSIPANDRHTCSTGPGYCYPSSDSTAFGTLATTSNWHSRTIRAHSSSWGDHQSRCPVPDHSRGSHRAIISTREPHYLIISLFYFVFTWTIRVDVPPQTTHEAATEPSSPPESPATWSFLYFILYLLVLIFYILDWMYYMIIFRIVLSQSNIYISFLFILGNFFHFLYSLLFCFFNHVVSPIRLRLNVTQEVPLLPFIYNCCYHIKGKVNLGLGES